MNNPTDRLRQNWQRVLDEVAAAAEQSGRQPADVQVVGVTKYVDAALTRALFAVGCTRLGENRPQTLWDKAAALSDQAPEWHLIGNLQRNKVRRTVPIPSLIHSVDSLRLAQSIAESAAELGRDVHVLLEVNVSGEAAKHGLPPGQVQATLDQLGQLEASEAKGKLRVMGLMAMAGLDSAPSEAQTQFAMLRECRDRARMRGLPANVSLDHLSMGMSDDFSLAIAEGATIVRIGSRLFAGIDTGPPGTDAVAG